MTRGQRGWEALSIGAAVLAVPLMALVLMAIMWGNAVLIAVASTLTAMWVVSAMVLVRREPGTEVIDLRQAQAGEPTDQPRTRRP